MCRPKVQQNLASTYKYDGIWTSLYRLTVRTNETLVSRRSTAGQYIRDKERSEVLDQPPPPWSREFKDLRFVVIHSFTATRETRGEESYPFHIGYPAGPHLRLPIIYRRLLLMKQPLHSGLHNPSVKFPRAWPLSPLVLFLFSIHLEICSCLSQKT